MSLLKKIISAIISVGIVLGSFSFGAVACLQTSAATFEDINQPSVFVKQQSSDTCTLTSNVMMLRRTALLNGDKDWASITEASTKSSLWYEGAGMLLNYTYKGITVTCTRTASTSAASIRTELINVLAKHPEGIVIYDYATPHAILLTDYTNGVFYCADPSNLVASGRIPISKASIQVEDIESYWYVVSPDVNFSPAATSEKWQVTSTNGINLRSGAGTGYSVYTTIPYQKQFTVTNKKSAEGYTWGYTTYNGYSGWCALNYAQCIDSSVLTNNSFLSSTTITKGSSVTITGSATGGTAPYKYTMLVRKSGESTWTTIRPSSATASYTWSPTSIGTYNVWIKVTDANGVSENKIINLNVKSTTPLTNTSTLSATTISFGSPIKITGSAVGGTGIYTYIIMARYSGNTAWTTLKVGNSYTWTPKKAGKYNLWVKVTDSSGAYQNKIVTVTVNG